MSQYAHLSEPDPEWLKATSLNLRREIPKVPTDSARYRQEAIETIRRVRATRPPPIQTGLRVVESELPVDQETILFRTYSPDPSLELGENETHRYPVLVYLYGGGCTFDSVDFLLRSLTVELRIVCLTVGYRKAPKHPFPVPLNDAYAALKWVVENAEGISGDIRKGLIVGGFSVGGNLAAVMAQRAMRDPDLQGKITGQLLIMPALIAASAYPDKFKDELLSLEEKFLGSDVLERFMRFYWEKYHGPHASNPEVSPALAPSFDGLPSAYIQIAGIDALRDEAFLYAKLLREAGNATKVDVYPGLLHGFHNFWPDLLASRRQDRELREGLKWLLQGGCA